MIRRVLRAPVVLGWLLWNVVLSSVALAKEAVTPGPIGTPVLVRYPMRCRTDVEITALAWAITVTPGTLVTVIGDDEMWVHVVLGGPRQEMIELLGRTEDRVLSEAAAADLDLVVDAAVEVQAVGLESDHVAGAVGALPAQGLHGRVLLGVLLGVQVSRQADSADHQLAGLPVAHRIARRIDHREVPAVQRQPDRHLTDAVQPDRAGDDGRLGGAVGVPHLATVTDQAFGQFRRAGLAAEDHHPDTGEHRIGPHRGEGRHRGDDGDPPIPQPRAEVEAGLDDRARRGHEARPVGPGQPHLLAGGVERHGQPRQDPVAGAQRRAGEEEPGLGVDERRGAAMRHGHTLGQAGGPGGEDDPAVVVHRRAAVSRGCGGAAGIGDEHAVGGVDGRDLRLTEHQLGALGGVVHVDGHVRRAGGEGAEDCQVEVRGARGHVDADPVAGDDALVVHPPGGGVDRPRHLVVAQDAGAVVDARRVRVAGRRGVEHVEECPGFRGV